VDEGSSWSWRLGRSGTIFSWKESVRSGGALEAAFWNDSMFVLCSAKSFMEQTCLFVCREVCLSSTRLTVYNTKFVELPFTAASTQIMFNLTTDCFQILQSQIFKL
jgi:hypothetical protein